MKMGVDAIFKFVAYTVPAISLLGGILLLVIGYAIDDAGMVGAGWLLVLLGAGIYVLEIYLASSS